MKLLPFNFEFIDSDIAFLSNEAGFFEYLNRSQLESLVSFSSTGTEELDLLLESKLFLTSPNSPGVSVNALASFIRHKTANSCEPSRWERYINGDMAALSLEQKQGALVFYGKGRCGACHSGDLLSDMKFHSIGVPQGSQGPYMFGQDLGRSMVTHLTQDRYRFRTPSLIGVSKTTPYGHNGLFSSLEEVVKYHVSPIFYFRNGNIEESMIFRNNEVVASRSDFLRWIRLDEKDFNALLRFIETL